MHCNMHFMSVVENEENFVKILSEAKSTGCLSKIVRRDVWLDIEK